MIGWNFQIGIPQKNTCPKWAAVFLYGKETNSILSGLKKSENIALCHLHTVHNPLPFFSRYKNMQDSLPNSFRIRFIEPDGSAWVAGNIFLAKKPIPYWSRLILRVKEYFGRIPTLDVQLVKKDNGVFLMQFLPQEKRVNVRTANRTIECWYEDFQDKHLFRACSYGQGNNNNA